MSALLRRAESAIQAELAAAPTTDAAPGVRLLAATLADDRLTLNFSRELLDLRPGSLAFETFLARVHRAAADELRADFAAFEIHTEIENVPLPQLFAAETFNPRRAPPPVARALAAASSGNSPGAQALAGRRIALSPGHGYYLDGTRYVLQREFFSGIVEDFVNHDFVTLVHGLLVADGADVRPLRNLDRNAGPGESGFPKWQEAARYHVKNLGADPSVWNESGFTALEQDIRCRPRYANTVEADLLVSLHNNGGGERLRDAPVISRIPL